MITLETGVTYGACIRVIGIGGAGGNAVNTMIECGLRGVDFIAANTDAQALAANRAPLKIQLGKELTRGLGSGADPTVGKRATEESLDELREALSGSDMVFLTAGMGGGTGTGGAPVVARLAQELGALVVAIVTKPFQWEARRRMQIAEAGIAELRTYVDALIVVPNQRLLGIIDRNTSVREAFQRIDEVLYNATRGIADIISGCGYVNVDFADVRTIMKGMGDALMGMGYARGERRAVEAAQSALNSPLLEGISIAGARGVLVNITGGSDLTMYEVADAMQLIEETAGSETNLIHGIVMSPDPSEEISITLVATGFRSTTSLELEPTAQQAVAVAAVEVSRVAAGGGASYVLQPIPAASPVGAQELQKYDEPAYLRRNTLQSAVPAPTTEPSPLEQPAFLRRL
ncbi:MAG: cell division protein FtsZ, partial [Candidatus Kapabacteria bacterium]|nr:cell division protein FtsZ [Candidatus Kapabacteria bacterium]